MALKLKIAEKEEEVFRCNNVLATVEKWWTDLWGSLQKSLSWEELGGGKVTLFWDGLLVECERGGFLSKERFRFVIPFEEVKSEVFFFKEKEYSIAFGVSASSVLKDKAPYDEKGIRLEFEIGGKGKLFKEKLEKNLSDWRKYTVDCAGLDDAILEHTKVLGKLALEEGVSLYHEWLDAWVEADDESIAKLVEDRIKTMIKIGQLDGHWDPERKLYRSKALIESKVVQVSIDYSTLRSLLTQKGFVLEAVKCPVCGGSLSVPDKGNITTCQYCKSTVYASDIFERLRTILAL